MRLDDQHHWPVASPPATIICVPTVQFPFSCLIETLLFCIQRSCFDVKLCITAAPVIRQYWLTGRERDPNSVWANEYDPKNTLSILAMPSADKTKALNLVHFTTCASTSLSYLVIPDNGLRRFQTETVLSNEWSLKLTPVWQRARLTKLRGEHVGRFFRKSTCGDANVNYTTRPACSWHRVPVWDWDWHINWESSHRRVQSQECTDSQKNVVWKHTYCLIKRHSFLKQ